MAKDRVRGETNQLEGKIRNMREESSQWKEYKLLREEASRNYPFIFSLAIKQQIVSDTGLSFVIYLGFI